MEQTLVQSESFKERNERFLRAITGDYEQRLVFSEQDRNLRKVIEVNASNELFSAKDDVEKIMGIRGLIAHRAFHRIYTDYTAMEKLLNNDAQHTKEYETAKELLEMIEDVAVEQAGCYNFPGLRPYIDFLNQAMNEKLPSINGVAANEGKLKAFKLAAWQYLNNQESTETIHDEQLQSIFELAKPYLQQVMQQRTTHDRVQLANMVTSLLVDLFAEVQEDEQTSFTLLKGEDMIEDNEGEAEEIPEEIMKEQQQEQQEQQEQGEGQPSQEQEQDSDSNSQEGQAQENQQSSESVEGKQTPQDDVESQSSQNSEETQDSSSQEKPEPSQEEAAEQASKMEEEIEKLKESLTEELEEMEKENENNEKQQKESEQSTSSMGDIDYGRMHRHMHIEEIKNIRGSQQVFNRIQENVKPHARSLSRRISNLLKYNMDEKRTGETAGYLSQGELWRKDGKIFSYRKDKNEETELAIVVLVDESGSMSHANRSKWARDAAVVMAEVCEKLEIPLSILGHTARFGSSEVQLRHYIGFEKSIAEQKKNLSEIRAREDNRDGMAIQYAGEYLLKQPQKDKLLLVIADGEPAHGCDNYYGDKAVQDCQSIIETLNKKNVTSVGIAIGDGQDQIQTMFKHFISIPKLESLPIKLVKILEKNIFKQ